MIKIIDGLGINLKTTALKELANQNKSVIFSDTMHFLTGGITEELFPGKSRFSTRIMCKYLEIKSVEANDRSGEVYVDRGISNFIIWSEMLRMKITPNYNEYITDDDAHSLQQNWQDYIRLEESLAPKRYLLKMTNRMVLSDALNMDLYDKDDHAAARIDSYKDVDNYLEMQEFYLYQYHSFGFPYTLITIDNSFTTYEDMTKYIMDIISE